MPVVRPSSSRHLVRYINEASHGSFPFECCDRVVETHVLNLLIYPGLLALLVRLGIPVPTSRGARVDFFYPILADIGDMQSVMGDLSTFSGHLLVSGEFFIHDLREKMAR